MHSSQQRTKEQYTMNQNQICFICFHNSSLFEQEQTSYIKWSGLLLQVLIHTLQRLLSMACFSLCRLDFYHMSPFAKHAVVILPFVFGFSLTESHGIGDKTVVHVMLALELGDRWFGPNATNRCRPAIRRMCCCYCQPTARCCTCAGADIDWWISHSFGQMWHHKEEHSGPDGNNKAKPGFKRALSSWSNLVHLMPNWTSEVAEQP